MRGSIVCVSRIIRHKKGQIRQNQVDPHRVSHGDFTVREIGCKTEGKLSDQNSMAVRSKMLRTKQS